MQPYDLVIPLTVALAVSCLSTPAIARLARAVRALDRPTARGVSLRPDVPLLGGLAAAAGFVAGIGVALATIPELGVSRQLVGLVAGSFVILVLGVCDDRYGIGAWPKLLVQVIAAGIAISHGFELGHFTDPISRTTFFLPTWLMWGVTAVWIVLVTNALNLVDGLDGLASGVGAIIAATLSLILWQLGQPLGVCVGVALASALLGFLPFNLPPARIFLGDTGALFIGYVLALLSLVGYRQISLITFVVPMLALAVPILDTALSVVRRLRLRAPIFSADRHHLHHRLLATEGSARAAVFQVYFLTGCFCLIAVSFTRLRGAFAAGFLVLVGILTLRLMWNLGVMSIDSEDRKAARMAARGEEREA